MQQQSVASSTTGAAVSIPRPSEVYYSKLNPLLKQYGLSSTDNRRDWPSAAQRKALDMLLQETPGDLLAK